MFAAFYRLACESQKVGPHCLRLSLWFLWRGIGSSHDHCLHRTLQPRFCRESLHASIISVLKRPKTAWLFGRIHSLCVCNFSVQRCNIVVQQILKFRRTDYLILCVCVRAYALIGIYYSKAGSFHPSNGATTQIGPWPPLLRFCNNSVLRCEVVTLTTNPR
jgi:hypothetical protein